MKTLIWLFCLFATQVYATEFGDIPATTDVSTLWVAPSRTLTIGGSAQNLSSNRTWTATTILDSLSSTQGTVLYRGASNWVGLGPGTDGNVLTTHGASANPTWTTPNADIHAAHFVTTQAESSLSNEFSLGSLGSGILKQTVSSSISTPSIAASADVIGLFTACSGTQYLGADGACHNAATAQNYSVTFVVDGSGSVLSTGTKNPIKIPFGGTLTGWLLIAKPSGSITVDIFRAADGAGLPVTSIVGGGTKPALSSAVENSSTSFTSWTSTALTAKDNLAISLSGISTSTYVALTLYYQ